MGSIGTNISRYHKRPDMTKKSWLKKRVLIYLPRTSPADGGTMRGSARIVFNGSR